MFQALDLGVKTLGHGIGDGVSKIGQQIPKMDFEHSGNVFNWSQPTTDRPAVPAIKKAFGLRGIKTAPELPKKFLDLPGSGDLASTGTQKFQTSAGRHRASCRDSLARRTWCH
jgi:hypothetical protein